MENTNRTRTVRLFGAFDRFNFGDLLYPLITKWLIENGPDDQAIRTCAPFASDQRAWGAEITVRLQDAVSETDRIGEVLVLVPGGEVLSQNWFGTMMASSTPEQASELQRRQAATSTKAAERHCRERLSCGRRFPWLLERATLGNRPRIAYNSVGGWPLERASAEDRRETARILAEAEFLSVRDARTWEILHQLSPVLRVRLAPDVASLLSEIWTRESLAGIGLSPEERSWPGSRYLCVQANSAYIERHLAEFGRQLDEMAAELDAGLVLMPFGRCTGWNDEDGLRLLKQQLRMPAVIVPVGYSLRRMAAVLAGAELFAGTSLHGVIAAAAYGVPTVPLLTDDPKVGNYLATWPIAGSGCVALADLKRGVACALADASRRMAVQVEVARRTRENFQEFLEVLGRE